MGNHQKFGIALALAAFVAGGTRCASPSLTGPVPVTITPPDKSILHLPTHLTARGAISGDWSYTVTGGTATATGPGGAFDDICNPVCPAVLLSPSETGQAKTGQVDVTVTYHPDRKDFSNYVDATLQVTYQFVAGTPTFTPAAGQLEAGATVAIASETPGATIRYTLDGTPPNAASTVYTAPIALAVVATVTAIATSPGYADSTAGSAAYAPPALAGACSAWNTAIAARAVACLKAAPDYLAARPGAIDCAALQADVQAGVTTFEPSRSADCTAALQALPCNALVADGLGPFVFATPSTSPGLFAFPMSGTACAEAIIGEGTQATPCHRDSQCADGHCAATATYICQDSTCQAPIGADASCTRPKECGDGLTCDSASRQCKAYAASGANCLQDSDCGPDRRCLDYSCNAPLAADANCGYTAQCAVGNLCLDGTCKALVGLGDACVAAVAPGMPTVCGAGFWCNAGVCAALPKAGESCEATFACTGGYCDLSGGTPTCKAYLDAGAVCTNSSQCASQLAAMEPPPVEPEVAKTLCVAPGEFYCTPP